MKFSGILLALIVVVSCAADSKKEYRGPSEADVVILDEETIESVLYESDEPWFLDLYADWCSHCHDMRPQWAKLATKLKGTVKVAKMDAGGKLALLEGYDFKGYPIIVFLPAGKKSKKLYYNYEGPRTLNDMSSWVTEKLQESKALYLPIITSQQIWNDYCVNVGKPLCVIFILPHIRDSSANERAVTLEIVKQVTCLLIQVIINYKDKPLSFLWTQATDHSQLELQFGFGAGYPVVLLLNQYRKAYTVMKSSLTSENLAAFLDKVLTPTKDRTKLGQYSKELTFTTVTL